MNTSINSARVALDDNDVWFTSDTHFSHANILHLGAGRPFKDVDHMNAEIIRRWNEVVSPVDTVFHLGDIALGPIVDSLPKVAALNGYKIAVLGNHDRPFMRAGKADESDWMDRYAEVFQEVWHWDGGILHVESTKGERKFRLSHFPYSGDSQDKDRHVNARPNDEGMPLIHGHTHLNSRYSQSVGGTPMVHVGQDAWNFTPVSLTDVLAEFDSHA